METTHATPASIVRTTTHPLLLVAAASVTAFSLAGIATLAGWLPGSHGAEPVRVAATATQAPTAEPVSAKPTVTLPQVKPVAAKPVERSSASSRHSVPAATGPSVTVSPAPTYSSSAPLPPICRECGVVEAVNEVTVEPKGSGGGAVAGGVVGGIIGNQVGKGITRDIATVLGAVGGAYAGNHIEKSVKETRRYDVVVHFEDGTTRTFSSDTRPTWQYGDHVRLQNGLLTMGGGRTAGNIGAI